WSAAIADESAQLAVFDKLDLEIVAGQGARVQDRAGRWYWDLYGGHAVSLIGHAHPLWAAVVGEQARRLPFYSNLTPHPLRAAACRMLVDLAPANLTKAFLTNSGAEANETALKLARHHTGRTEVIAFEGSFHGRTAATLAVTWNPKYRNYAAPGFGHTRFLPFGAVPGANGIPEIGSDVAAVIIEPIQSLNGMTTATPELLASLRAACDQAGALLILDEVQTAWGRLGSPFAADYYGVRADLITGAKSAAGGFPVGVTLVDQAIAARVKSGDQGSTFGAGPLACAAILATHHIVKTEGLMANARAVEDRLRTALSGTPFHGVRGHGCLLGIETPRPTRELLPSLRARGFMAGGSDDPHVMRLMPPLCLPLTAVDELAAALRDLG
ncbi:MAG: aspartate aminotransferase family protein, partial [Myxococcales bacterium]|nr:aspartate aminotransferase family protein [Myxococcales bacterium]